MEKIVIEFDADIAPLLSIIDVLKAIDPASADALSKGMQHFQDFKKTVEDSKASITANTNAIADNKKNLDDLSNSLKQVPTNVAAGAMDQLTKNIIDNSTAIVDNTTKHISFRQQLRQLREEMALLESQGKDDTQQFKDLELQAGKVSHQIQETTERIRIMADPTKNIKAMGEAVRGLAAGFEVVKGAQGLFGEKNEEIERSILKVQSAMALANGVQEISNLLLKENYLVSTIRNLNLKATAILTGELSIVTVAQSAATSVATGAQWLMNTAMEAFPLFAIIAGITVVIQLWEKFSSSVDDATESLKKLNDESRIELETIKTDAQENIRIQENKIKSIEGEIAARKASGQTAEQLHTKNLQLEDARQAKLEMQKQLMDDLGKQAQKNGSIVYDESTKHIDVLKQIQVEEASLKMIEDSKAKGDKIDAEKIKYQNRINNLKELATAQVDYENESQQLSIKSATEQAELEKNKIEDAKKATEKYKEEAKKRAEAQKKSLLEIFETDVAYSTAAVENATKNSAQELQAKIDLENAKAALEREQVTLSDSSAQLKAAKITEINAKEIATVTQLQNEFATKQIDIAQKIADEKKKLGDEFTKRSDDEYKAALLQENESYQSEKKLLDEKFITGELKEKDYNAALIQLEEDKNNALKKIAADYKATVKQAKDDEVKFDNDAENKKVEHYKMTAAEKERIEKQVAQELIKITGTVVNDEFQLAQDVRQKELDDRISSLETQKSNELANTNLTASQKKAIEDKYKKEEAALKLKAWQEEQKAKEEQAIINGALAITNILATMPKFDFGIASGIAIAASIVSTAEQVRVIAGAKPPQFAKGKNISDYFEGYGEVGEAGREFHISGNHVELVDKATLKWIGKDDIILPNPLTEHILNMPLPIVSAANVAKVQQQYQTNQSATIDYEKLGKVAAKHLGKEIKNLPIHNFSFDADGFKMNIEEGLSKKTILTNRYTTKKG